MYSPRKYDAIWTGPPRYVSLVVAAILCMSIITLCTSAVYGTQLAHAPLDPIRVEFFGAHRWSNAQVPVSFKATFHAELLFCKPSC